tara:strand:+ start:679 stop:867 length:189 start_codon:yes stop_codon:yes gene_type:complete
MTNSLATDYGSILFFLCSILGSPRERQHGAKVVFGEIHAIIKVRYQVQTVCKPGFVHAQTET